VNASPTERAKHNKSESEGFLLTKRGGLRINLTTANIAALYVSGGLDIVKVLLLSTTLSRNPQADLQAVGRIGQTLKQVNVHFRQDGCREGCYLSR